MAFPTRLFLYSPLIFHVAHNLSLLAKISPLNCPPSWCTTRICTWALAFFSIHYTPELRSSDASIKFHFYADDTQLYISFSSSDSDQKLDHLSSVLDQVYSWFCANRLSVNPSKTEYLLIGTPQQRDKIINSSVYFQNLDLTPSHTAQNLGVIFDENLDFKAHISTVSVLLSFKSVNYERYVHPLTEIQP